MDANAIEMRDLDFLSLYGQGEAQALAKATLAVQADHLDTYAVFKAKDKKVRGRVKALEDKVDELITQNNNAVEDNHDIFRQLDRLTERLNALEEHLAHKTVVALPPETRVHNRHNHLEDAVQDINRIIFGDPAYGKINLGTLKELNKEGLLSASVQQELA